MQCSTVSKIFFSGFLVFAPLANSAATPSIGCGEAGLSSGTYEMDDKGITRIFRVHVPRGYDKDIPTPLVTIFHGWGGNENEFIGSKTVTSEANKHGYILVAPRGLGSGFPDGSYNSWSFSGSTTGLDGSGTAVCDHSITPDYSYPSCSTVKDNSCSWTQCQANDVDFVVALIEEVKTALCIDTDRVFATGGSNGGMFTWELAQNRTSAREFRAIAPLIGLPHRAYLEAQGKDSDMPALVITGTRDKVVPPGAWEDPSFTTTSNGGDRFYYTGATAITRSWADQHEGCNSSVPATSFNTGYRKADCRTYCPDDSSWPRVLDCRAKMGHSYSFQWSWKLIMDFFDAHSVEP